MEPWIQVYGGAAVDLVKPDLSSFTFEELAHSLSRIARFSGHTKGQHGYSVAQHSIYVSRLLPASLRFAGLLHDAHEAFIGDITSPVKWLIEQKTRTGLFREIEKPLIQAIEERFDVALLPPRLSDNEVKVIHTADLQMLAVEKRDLLHPGARLWSELPECPPNMYIDDVWSPEKASASFLVCVKYLRGSYA